MCDASLNLLSRACALMVSMYPEFVEWCLGTRGKTGILGGAKMCDARDLTSLNLLSHACALQTQRHRPCGLHVMKVENKSKA